MPRSINNGFYADDPQITIDQRGEGQPFCSCTEVVGRRRWDRFRPRFPMTLK